MPIDNWPLEPRPGQRKTAEELADLLVDNRRIVFSAPTGWGKTMAVIAALVEANLLPAVWLVRSLALGKRVAADAALWSLRTFIAAGREKTCLLKDRVKDVNEYCKYFRFKCSYARLPSQIPSAADFTELVNKGRQESWCPYFAQDLVSSEILVQNYFRRMKPLRMPNAFVYDEAHNLLLPKEKTFTLSQIIESVTIAKNLGASERLLRGLESMTTYITIKDGALDASLYLEKEAIDELRRLHIQGLEHGVSLRPLLDLVSVIYIEGEKVTAYSSLPLTLFRPALLVSATMPPGAETLLGADAVVRIPWTVKPICKIVSDVTTRYEEFDTKIVTKYRKILVEISRKFKRVLVFAPSERVAKELRGIVQYEECEPPSDWQGLTLYRARGKFSEGVDVPADAVLIAGAPFLPPAVGEWLARQMRRAGVNDPVRASIDIPMLVTTLQCVGRAWRDPQKPPYVVLADWRFERYSATLKEFFTLE